MGVEAKDHNWLYCEYKLKYLYADSTYSEKFLKTSYENFVQRFLKKSLWGRT
jgi:hypothetical protein